MSLNVVELRTVLLHACLTTSKLLGSQAHDIFHLPSYLIHPFETGIFEKTECSVKIAKKCFLKKLSVWLTLIKVEV